MADPGQTPSDDVEHLLLNARLRDELEPFVDDSITTLAGRALPTPVENEYLASMLAWERAPMLPISRWFEPELALPHPRMLGDGQLHEVLWETIRRLYEKRIVLDFTDHLSDRELYSLIYRDILPTHEKKIDNSNHYLHWDCADMGSNAETWLRYYASDEERRMWADAHDGSLPPHESPPYCRQLPRQPL